MTEFIERRLLVELARPMPWDQRSQLEVELFKLRGDVFLNFPPRGSERFGIEATRMFIDHALADNPPVLESLSRSGKTYSNQIPPLTRRDLDFTVEYIKTPLPLKEVGAKFSINTKARASMIIKKTLPRLWALSSPETQRVFPLSHLSYDKFSLLEVREEISRRAGGKLTSVLQMLDKGLTSQQIASELGITLADLGSLRKRLRAWGKEMPYVNRTPAENDQLAQDLADPDKTESEVKELLGKVNGGFVQTIQAKKVVISLTAAIESAGYHIKGGNLQPFLDVLERAEVPIPTVHLQRTIKTFTPEETIQNYFYLSRVHHLKRAQEIWRNDPSLDQFL